MIFATGLLLHGTAGCKGDGWTDWCLMTTCGISDANPVPAGRSAVCDYDVEDQPNRLDHCLIFDGASAGDGWFGVPAENCDQPYRERRSAICAPLKDPLIGGDVLTCEVEGVPMRCMWIPVWDWDDYGPSP